MNVGYDKPLYILPFDHRSTFLEKMLGIKGRRASREETHEVKSLKQIVYRGFEKSLETGVPRDYGALLVDEEYGDEILRDAAQKGYTVLLTTEKSGQKEFDFEYGDEFGAHIKKYNPTFAKALVRYNPEGERELNARQLVKLKRLSDFCHENGYKLLVEPLVPATEEQRAQAGGNEETYDTEIRPTLVVQMIKEFQEAGVEVDVWKLEGMTHRVDYEKAVFQARANERMRVGIVILGRGANPPRVKQWIKAGVCVPGVIGLAVGRTVFWDALVLYRNQELSREQTVSQIAQNFVSFCSLFKVA